MASFAAMSRVPDEPRSWPPDARAEEVAADLKRQLEAVKAKVEEHRAVMRMAGLTHASDAEKAERDG